MAKCDEGYLCEICGQEVECLDESELYLRFVVGLLDPETLHTTKEKHIRCNPTLAQFIVHRDFAPVVVDGDFSKTHLDADYVTQQESLLTRGWLRLRELIGSDQPLLEYPLPEVQERLRSEANSTPGPDELR